MARTAIAPASEQAAEVTAEPGFIGRILLPGRGEFAIMVWPKAIAEHDPTPWSRNMKRVEGAMSFCDGLANTEAMAKAGSKLAQWTLDLGLYIPARD